MFLQDSFVIEKTGFAFLQNNINQLKVCLLDFFNDPTKLRVPAVLIGVLLVLSVGYAAELSRGGSDRLTLGSAVSLAVKDNPGLAEMYARS